MEYIDVNTMIGKWPFRKLGTTGADELFRELGRVGIKRAIVSSFRSQRINIFTGNEELFQTAEKFEEMIPCPEIVPLINGEQGYANTAAYLEYLRGRGAGFVRITPKYNGFSATAKYFDETLAYLERYRMPLLVKVNDLDRGKDDVERICEKHPDLRLIVLNHDHENSRGIYFLLQNYPNLYFETSFLSEMDEIESIVGAVGSRGLLLGTRMPFMEPGRMVGRMAYSPISYEDKCAICFKNAEKLIDEAGKEC